MRTLFRHHFPLYIVISLLAGALSMAAPKEKEKQKEGATPPPASIDPSKRPEVWRDLKPSREGDPPQIPSPHPWHNAVQYHDGYVYATGWVVHVLGRVSGDGDVCFNLALDEPFLGLRNSSNNPGQIHCEISPPKAKKPQSNGTRHYVYKSLGLPPATPGLKGSETAAEEARLFKDFTSKILGKHVEVLGVWTNDTGHKKNDPWLEIHPCIRLRLLNATENVTPPPIDKNPFEPDKDKDKNEGEEKTKERK